MPRSHSLPVAVGVNGGGRRWLGEVLAGSLRRQAPLVPLLPSHSFLGSASDFTFSNALGVLALQISVRNHRKKHLGHIRANGSPASFAAARRVSHADQTCSQSSWVCSCHRPSSLSKSHPNTILTSPNFSFEQWECSVAILYRLPLALTGDEGGGSVKSSPAASAAIRRSFQSRHCLWASTRPFARSRLRYLSEIIVKSILVTSVRKMLSAATRMISPAMLVPMAMRTSRIPADSAAVATSCQHTSPSKHNIWMLNRARYHFCQSSGTLQMVTRWPLSVSGLKEQFHVPAANSHHPATRP